MGCQTAAQVLKDAEDLKAKISKKRDWLNNYEAWTDQQRLQTMYKKVLKLDLEYALDKKVEQDLWNFGFKTHISCLQESVRDKKNPNRSDCQALLKWALESASGFYISLLLELSKNFNIDLPFLKDQTNTIRIQSRNVKMAEIFQRSSCLYICQYCLVHLGDIHRYMNRLEQAELFYDQAILVSPISGQPYNQLALLEASRGNKLSTVFYYIRGICLRNPFPASATNLSCTLKAAIEKHSPSEKIHVKMTVNEFIQLFLCTHGYFHNCCELTKARQAVQSMNSIMTSLVATQSFQRDMLIQITVVNLYSLAYVGNKLEELTPNQIIIRELIVELIAGTLCAYLVPVHTLKMDESLLDYYALPAVKFLLCAIQNEPELLTEKVFTSKLQIWPGFVKLLNNVQKYLKEMDFTTYQNVPLPEDRMVQGFLPLSKSLKNFDFKEEIKEENVERLVRMKRLVDIGLWLTEIDSNGNKFIIKKETSDVIVFEPGFVQPDPTIDLLEEMRSFRIESPEVLEKKAGILKPQGSLEKSREERELLTTNKDTAHVNGTSSTSKFDLNKTKRGKQNVALQSILKKMEDTNKQVKFIVDMPMEKEKSVKFESTSTLQPMPLPTIQHQSELQQQSQLQPLSLSSGQVQQSTLLPQSSQNSTIFPIAPPPPPIKPPDYFSTSTLQSLLAERGLNYQFPKPEQPVSQRMSSFSNHQMLSPYQNLQQNVNQNINQQPSNNFTTTSSFGNNQLLTPFQNNSFPSSHPFNTWKTEDVASSSNLWWQNNQTNQHTQNYTPENFSMNFAPYSNFNGSSMSSSQQNIAKSSNASQNSTGRDIFTSPWDSFTSLDSTGYDDNQGLSMRQAMLKEAMPYGPQGSAMNRISNPPPSEPNYNMNGTNTPGYSLFNTNSWTPNLAGQLCNPKQSDGRTQQQFNGHTPISLAQLLEQQNQLNTKINL